MNPQTKCCRNCVHARWKYREFGSIDRDEYGVCAAAQKGERGPISIKPLWGTECSLFENQSNPVTEESKRMSAAAIEARRLSGELFVRFADATEEQHRSGQAGDWKHQSSVLEWAAEILEREAK